MTDLPFADLIADLPVKRTTGDALTSISSVCYDSREVQPGSLFVALKGDYTDGHQYLDDALRRGAAAVLVEDWSPQVEGFQVAAQVEHTRAALATVATRFYGSPGDRLGVIGVTGTDGKTTTSYLIEAMLRSTGLKTGMIGTVAVRIGGEVQEHDTRQTTPESLQVQRLLAVMRDANVDWTVLEATSHGLELSRLDGCPFDIGVVTNITSEHLDFHGSVDNYRRAKARLLERVSADRGRQYPHGVVLNADDEGARSVARWARNVPVIRFSTQSPDVEIYASDIDAGVDGSHFELHTPTGSSRVDLRLVGGYNVENALAAAGVGHLLGFQPDHIAKGLASLQSVPGRLVRVDVGQPFSVFVDYAHTPESLDKTMRLVRTLVDGRLIVVFGSAGERDRVKRPVQGQVGVDLADFAIFTSEDPRFEDPDKIIAEIADGAVAKGAVEGRDFLRIEDRKMAIKEAIERAQPGDAVLLAGKGHEQCMIYGAEKRPWDEAKVAEEALRTCGY